MWDLSCQESKIGTHGGSAHGGAAANAASGKKDGAVRMPDEEEDKT